MLPLSTILGKINPLEKETTSNAGEFYLSLVISDRWVKSAIWNLTEEGEKNLTFGSSETWSDSAEELIVAADASIATAVTKLPAVAGKQPNKVILGLPENWVEGNTVKESKLTTLQKVCQKLALKPLGFVVTPEAIAHYLKQKEGGLPSAILLSLEETEIVVSLIVKGKFLGSKLVGRSDNLALDLEEGLLRFNFQEVLPNRILLIEDSEAEDIEEMKHTLVAYPWVSPNGDKKLNFLQLPRVEVAEKEFEVTAVVVAGCRELGLDKESPAQKTILPLDTEEEGKEEVAAVAEPTVGEGLPEEDFGFVKDKDILVESPLEEEEEKTEVPKIETVTEESQTVEVPQTSFGFLFSSKLAAFWHWCKNLVHLPKPAFRFSAPRGLLLLAGILAAGLVAVFLLFWQTAKAEVKIFIQPQKIEEEFEFVLSAKAEAVDAEEMTVPARETSVKVVGEKTANVTGKKTVGDKATGEVVVYNRTDEVKSLAKDAVLKGPGELKFVLKDEVKIASKTADLAEGVDKWGEAKVGVEAKEIGAEYNLAADSILTFENFPSTSLLVKNPNAFSGGTSREIQAVSKEDRASLQKALLAQLEGEAKQEIQAQIAEGDQLLSDSVKLKDQTNRFDHEVGDEASSINLKSEASFTALFVKQEDFEILTEKVMAELVPEGYQRKKEAGESSFSLKDEKKRLYLAQVNQEFWPEIKLNEIPDQLKAQSLAKGKASLEGLNQVVGLEIKIKPKLFSSFKFFPLKRENINVVLQTL